MRLTVRHETRYAFDAPASYAVQRLTLTPRSFAAQKVLQWSIEAPGIENALAYQDGFGNQVHLLTYNGNASELTVLAHGVIETTDSAGLVSGLTQAAPDAIFLRQTGSTAPDGELLAMAAEAGRAGQTMLDQLHALLGLIHRRVAYETGSTDVQTSAGQALARGRGVCQDHAHIFLSAARALGIPSRFVTGYIVTGVGQSATAGHAWAEALVPDLGWCGFDATNCKSPDGHYVRVASGLDALSVTPVRGSRRGGGGERLEVSVRVEMTGQ